MQEPCSVAIFSHRKLLILAVPKLWKKCQQKRRGKNSHPAERNFFLTHIIRSQETLKYNTAIFTSVGVMQLLQHSPWGEPVMSYPSPCLDPNFQRSLGRKQEMEPFSWQVLPKTALQGFSPTPAPNLPFSHHLTWAGFELLNPGKPLGWRPHSFSKHPCSGCA